MWPKMRMKRFAIETLPHIYVDVVYLQLLSVSPSRNALSLVYCDQDTLSFTKYINHRSNCTDSYIITAFTYREKYLPS